MIQVQQISGVWKDVTLPAGHVAILPGYTLERATCGLVKATTHRVVSMGMNASFSDHVPHTSLWSGHGSREKQSYACRHQLCFS